MISLPPSLTAQTLDWTCAIQQIPAPTFNEGWRAEFLYAQFQALQLDSVQIDSTGNVLARLPGGPGKPVVVSAHLDSVFPIGFQLHLDRQPERICGPGIGDNALGVAALLALAEAGRSILPPLSGDLWLAATVGEEGLGNLRGIRAITQRFGAAPLAYLVLEGMGLGNILHRGLGSQRYRVTMHTPGGHSWVNYGRPSAIHELGKLIYRLTILPVSSRPRSSLNIGVIRGGTSVNTIAPEAWLELDLRSEDLQTLESLVDRALRVIETARSAEVEVEIKVIGKRPAGAIPLDAPLVQSAAMILSELGLSPRFEIASTEANLPLSLGYPCVALGLTHGEGAHTAQESILTAPVSQGILQLIELVARILTPGSSNS